MACHVIREPNDPTDAPPFSGMHFVNTDTGALFESNGTATVANWILKNGGSVGGVSHSESFWDDGSLGTTFLKRTNNHAEKSDVEPYECKFDLTVVGLSFMNKNDNADIDIKIYKNASLLFTWSLTDARHAIKTNGLSSLTFVATDLISVEGVAGTTDPSDTLVELDMSYTSTIKQEVKSGTL